METWCQPGFGFGHLRTREGQCWPFRACRCSQDELDCAGDGENATALWWKAGEYGPTKQHVLTFLGLYICVYR